MVLKRHSAREKKKSRERGACQKKESRQRPGKTLADRKGMCRSLRKERENEKKRGNEINIEIQITNSICLANQ
jgi:hypothetical protein